MRPVIADITCGRRPWVQISMNGSIICLSVRPVVCEDFAIFVFVLISSLGVQHRDAFIPILGSKGPQWVPGKLVCMSSSLVLSVSLFGLPHHFLVIIKAWTIITRCVCGYTTQVMQYNTYSSTIFPHWGPVELICMLLHFYVCLSVSLFGDH